MKKKKLSLKGRLMIVTTLLLIVLSVLFTVFSIGNAMANIVKPFEKMYIDQHTSGYNREMRNILDEEEHFVIYINDINEFFYVNIIFMIIVILIGSGVTYLVTIFSLKPLRIWSKEITSIDGDKLSKRIKKLNTGDEMDILADSFNQLLDRLQNAFDRERRFSAAAAHELKTPLAVVKANVEFLQIDENPEIEDYAEALEVIKKQNERMIQLVNDLMLMFSSDAYERSDFIDLDAVIREIENEMQSVLQSEHIKFEYNEAGFRIKGNEVLMKHAMSNLIQNAIKYNIKGGEILISQTLDNNQYKISVSDTGIGIREADRPYIFEPFYRAEKSRKRPEGGSGLGLSITKEILEAHRGTIVYQAREPQGSIFSIYIPSVSAEYTG